LCSTTVAQPLFGAAGPPPWALRDHLNLEAGDAALLYDVKTAEWRLNVKQRETPMVDLVGFEVELADGTSYSAADLGEAEYSRDPFDEEGKRGTRFGSTFPAKDGLVVVHGVTRFVDQPFVLMRLSVRNVGDVPIEVAALRPIVMGADCMAPMGPSAELWGWPLVWRGSAAVYSGTKAYTFALLHEPDAAFCLAMGAIPQGLAATEIVFTPDGAAWQGAVHCRFNPALVLEPGASLDADPVWLSYSLPEPDRACQYYAWVCRETLGIVEKPKALPALWTTAPEGCSANDLYAAAERWKGVPSPAVLVPNAWESPPGSLCGATPRFPRDMKRVAEALAALGAKPGLTLDGLLVGDVDKDCTALSIDGRRWADITNPKALKVLRDRVERVRAMGFQFLVLAPSAIPDEVLRHFGMTRMQADALAFRAMRDVAGDMPVLAGSATKLRAEPALWLEAAGACGALGINQVSIGAVGFDPVGARRVDEDLALALWLFSGPIECSGNPEKGFVTELASALRSPRIPGLPLGARHSAARIWHARGNDEDEHMRGDSLFVLPGAGAWRIEDLGVDLSGGRRLWQAEDGVFLDPASSVVTAGEKPRIYGITSALTRPMFLGTSTHGGCRNDDVDRLAWAETAKGGVLSGVLHARCSGPTTAYVAAPSGWSLRSGEVGSRAVKGRDASALITFEAPGGQPTPFRFEFERRQAME